MSCAFVDLQMVPPSPAFFLSLPNAMSVFCCFCRCLRETGIIPWLGTRTMKSHAGACGVGVISKPWGTMTAKTQKPAPSHPPKLQHGGRVTSRPLNSHWASRAPPTGTAFLFQCYLVLSEYLHLWQVPQRLTSIVAFLDFSVQFVQRMMGYYWVTGTW